MWQHALTNVPVHLSNATASASGNDTIQTQVEVISEYLADCRGLPGLPSDNACGGSVASTALGTDSGNQFNPDGPGCGTTELALWRIHGIYRFAMVVVYWTALELEVPTLVPHAGTMDGLDSWTWCDNRTGMPDGMPGPLGFPYLTLSKWQLIPPETPRGLGPRHRIPMCGLPNWRITLFPLLGDFLANPTGYMWHQRVTQNPCAPPKTYRRLGTGPWNFLCAKGGSHLVQWGLEFQFP